MDGPKKTWKESVQDEAKAIDLTLPEIEEVAQDPLAIDVAVLCCVHLIVSVFVAPPTS